MARSASRFVSGSAVYKCRCCGRSTRQTGRGDNDLASLCAECFDLGGEENHLSDNGDFYESPAEVLRLIAEVAAKGGDASCWDELKAKAEAANQPKIELPPVAESPKIAAPLNQPKKVRHMKVAAAILSAANGWIAIREDAEALKAIPLPDFAAFWNAHCVRFIEGAEPVEKFANRAQASKKVLQLADAIVAYSVAEPAKKEKEAGASDADRSAAIAATWADPAVAEARKARHAVKVGGEVYASVRKAFDALGIDQNQRQKFRKLLVAEGKGEIGGHKFTLVTAA